jgi:endonuclease-3
LHHEGAFELLVATILSAQTTDVGVNRVTPVLFAKYPTPDALAKAQPAVLEQIIKSTGYFRSKTRSLIGMANALVDNFGGKVPDTMEDLVTLPGVGRKTANVVLGSAFGKNVGIVVDTHVKRLSERLGLTKNTDPAKIEQDLMRQVPQKDWSLWSHLLIFHGRQVCFARKPACDQCVLNDICPSAFKV